MERVDIVGLLNSMLIPLGFKRKGSNWTQNGEAICKLVNLQRSYYSKSYYINYGFILKKIPLTTMTHLGGRLGSVNSNENGRINYLLDFESAINKESRLKDLQYFIEKLLIPKLVAIETEEEFLQEVKNSPYSSMIPLVVKEYFHLEEW